MTSVTHQQAALARQDETGALTITHSALAETTRIKGTLRNVFGIQGTRLVLSGINVRDISLIRINDHAGDWRCGDGNHYRNHHHRIDNDRPQNAGPEQAGVGMQYAGGLLAAGGLVPTYILVVSSAFDFADIANGINTQCAPDADYRRHFAARRWRTGQQPAGKSLPIVDEVLYIDRIPLGMLAAMKSPCREKGYRALSNYYGIAVFNLSADEGQKHRRWRALIGNRSAVVVKTPSGVKRAQYPPVTHGLQAQGHYRARGYCHDCKPS